MRAGIGWALGVVIAFHAGRVLHGNHLAAPTGRAASATHDAAAPAPARPVLALLHGFTASRLAAPATDDRERRIVATKHDTPEMRDLRHELQRQAILRAAPALASDAIDQMVDVNDRFTDERRAARAAFVLGDLGEREYIEAIKESTRDSAAQMKQLLDRDGFEAAFHWRYDSDPFDPEGAIAQAEAPTEGAPDLDKVANRVLPRPPALQ
jgi:hypothetical protein